MRVRTAALSAVLLFSGLSDQRADQSGATTAVNLVRLPSGGIQPQVAIDATGDAHVVYFVGEPANGDLFYTRFTNGSFSSPIRVNSAVGSAIATGTVRGARIAIGRDRRIHVAWNGSNRAMAAGSPNPMLYARLNHAGSAFEPQRNLITFASGIDGGGALAADSRGNVYVAWHAGGPNSKNEGERRVWMTVSSDDGRTFQKERAISPIETGACGCCGMDGLADGRGNVYFLYRSAREVMNRDSYLLSSTNGGRTFRSVLLQPWGVGQCPMSTYELVARDGLVLAAWETGGVVRYAGVTPRVQDNPPAITPPGVSRARRHPSLAINGRGEILLSWSEGTGWQRGGAVAWQVFDRSGKPTSVAGQADGVPVWGLTAAFARPDHGFTIVY